MIYPKTNREEIENFKLAFEHDEALAYFCSKPRLKLIVAVDDNFAIGCQGNLLCYLPEDLKRFKALTSGGTIIYGRKTLFSFPGAKPLPKRDNFLLSASGNYSDAYKKAMIDEPERILAFENLLDLFQTLSLQPKDTWDDLWLIGGASLYEILLPYVKTVELTRILTTFEPADAFVSDYSKLDFECVSRSDIYTDKASGLQFCYEKYERL